MSSAAVVSVVAGSAAAVVAGYSVAPVVAGSAAPAVAGSSVAPAVAGSAAVVSVVLLAKLESYCKKILL